MENKQITKAYLINRYCNTAVLANRFPENNERQLGRLDLINELLMFFNVYCCTPAKDEFFKTVYVRELDTDRLLSEITLNNNYYTIYWKEEEETKEDFVVL